MCPPPIRVFEEFCPFFVILQAFHTRVLSTGVLLTVCFIGYWMELARFARVVRQLHGPCLGILPLCTVYVTDPCAKLVSAHEL